MLVEADDGDGLLAFMGTGSVAGERPSSVIEGTSKLDECPDPALLSLATRGGSASAQRVWLQRLEQRDLSAAECAAPLHDLTMQMCAPFSQTLFLVTNLHPFCIL